jgi:amino acid transporter
MRIGDEPKNPLPTGNVTEADYALAEAARPVFGVADFSIVAIAALVSTASSIKANLYAVANVTCQLAKEGKLPTAFGQPMGRPREDLLISAGLIILLGYTLDLSEIAAVGSLTILIVHLMLHFGHLLLLRETAASPTLGVMAIVFVLVALVFSSLHALQASPHVLWLVTGSLVAATVMEILRVDLVDDVAQIAEHGGCCPLTSGRCASPSPGRPLCPGIKMLRFGHAPRRKYW